MRIRPYKSFMLLLLVLGLGTSAESLTRANQSDAESGGSFQLEINAGLVDSDVAIHAAGECHQVFFEGASYFQMGIRISNHGKTAVRIRRNDQESLLGNLEFDLWRDNEKLQPGKDYTVRVKEVELAGFDGSLLQNQEPSILEPEQTVRVLFQFLAPGEEELGPGSYSFRGAFFNLKGIAAVPASVNPRVGIGISQPICILEAANRMEKIHLRLMKARYDAYVLKDGEKALAEIVSLSREEPSSTLVWSELAVFYAKEMGDMKRALEAAEKFRQASMAKKNETAAAVKASGCCRQESLEELLQREPEYNDAVPEDLRRICRK